MVAGRGGQANPKFCPFAVEFVIDKPAEIRELKEGAGELQRRVPLRFEWLGLSEVAQLGVGSVHDFAGVVMEVFPGVDVTVRSGGTMRLLKVLLADESCLGVELALWGARASAAEERVAVGSVVLLKGVKVAEWRGKSLSALDSSLVVLEGDADSSHPRADELRRWFRGHGGLASCASLATRFDTGLVPAPIAGEPMSDAPGGSGAHDLEGGVRGDCCVPGVSPEPEYSEARSTAHSHTGDVPPCWECLPTPPSAAHSEGGSWAPRRSKRSVSPTQPYERGSSPQTGVEDGGAVLGARGPGCGEPSAPVVDTRGVSSVDALGVAATTPGPPTGLGLKGGRGGGGLCAFDFVIFP